MFASLKSSTRMVSRSRCSSPIIMRAPRNAAAPGSTTTSNRASSSARSRWSPIISTFRNRRPGEPTLLTFDEVKTAFHEFGHALHGMFSDVKYPRFTGTNVPRDFVEYPSQVNEMWATWPEVLKNYAKHYQTGEPMPDELLDKVLATRKIQPRLQDDRIPGSHPARSGLAPIEAGGGAERRARLRSRGAEESGRRSPDRFRRVIAAPIFRTLSPAATRRAITPTFGAKCSMPTPSTGSSTRRFDTRKRRPFPRHAPVARRQPGGDEPLPQLHRARSESIRF